MRPNNRVSIAFIVATSAFFLIAWNPLKPILNYFASVFTGGETSIPLPLPNVQVGISGKPAFSLNIQVPPGAGDIVPEIAINYTSGAGQSILGKGWNLSGFPRISKNPNLGVHFGSSDGYSSNLLGDLISTGTGGVYRTKIESFYKATFDGTAWSLRNPSGVIYEYGRNNASGYNSIIQGDSGPVAFYIDRVRDTFGNGYDITYTSDTLNSDEPLPQEIKYARGNARITFTYSNRSNSWKEQIFFLTNNSLRKKVLSKIQVYANDSGGSEQLTDTYDFTYDSSSEIGPLLISFERENYKPLVFNYTERTNQSSILSSSSKNFDLSYKAEDPDIQSDCAATQTACLCTANYACLIASGGLAQAICGSGIMNYQDMCANGVTTSFVTPADTNGDGVPEIVRVNGTMTNQKFSVTPLSDWETATGNSLTSSNTLVGSHIGITVKGRILPGDYNGDGKSDFLVLTDNGDPLKVYYGPDFSSMKYSVVTVAGLNANSTVTKQFVADINGDGKTDYIQANSSNNLVIYTSTGSGFQLLQTLAITNFGTEFQQMVDFDRNGVPDFVRINGTTSKDFIVTFLDFQNGTLQASETTKVSRTDFGKQGDQFISDINGDGYPDFAFFAMTGSQGTVSYYPFTGRSFLTNGASPLQTINVNKAYARQVSGAATVTYVNVDLSGDGIKDQVSYNNSNASSPFFNVQIYDTTQAKYLTAVKVPWNQDVSTDLNGDGVVDILRADSTVTQQTDANGATITDTVTKFQSTITNGSYSEVPIDLNSYIATSSNSSNSSTMGYFNWRNPKDFIDLNSDGKSDFVRYDASSSTLYVSYATLDSNGYITYSASGDDTWSTGGYLLSIDANGDGKPEMVGMNASQVNLVTTKQSSIPGVLTNVVRSFPYESSVQLHYIRFDQALPSGLLTTIQNGSSSSAGDLALGLEYQLAKNHTGAIQPSLYDSSKPQFLPFTGADYLVTRLTQKAGSSTLSSDSYKYSNGRFYLNGFRNSSYAGFQQITNLDEISNESVVTNYDPSFIEMVGIPTSQIKSKNGIKLSESTSSYAKTTSALGGILIQQTSDTQTKYQGGQALFTTSSSHSYDTYGNETSKTININGNIVVQSTTYQNNWTSGFIGQPTELQITSNGQLVSDKKISYSNFQVSQIQDLVSNGVWKTNSIQSYDSYGNPSVTKDANGNVNTIEYDLITYKFPVKITNSLGHVIQRTNDYTTGLLLTSTNGNGGTSKTDYDKFGRPIASYLPGETDWSEKIEYENTGDLESQLIRKIFKRTNGISWQEETSNVLTKISKKRSSLVDSSVLVEEAYQNQEGQTIKKIDPYIEGSNPFTWTTYTYNTEGNLTTSQKNDGTSTQIELDGLSTTITTSKNGNQIDQLVEIMNSYGKVVSRTRQGKTIQFQYGANGKASQIIDPENGVTTIATDLTGRQTSVTNPNSGTITTTYDATTGNVSSQTYANGSKIQYSYDVLGRPTFVQGIGFQGETIGHTYEYDSTNATNGIGRLTKVTDQHGTTEFGYDIRGNITAFQKHLIDEDLTFLIQKKYNLQNQIEEITYPDGSIAKNVYSEAGYLLGIKLTPADGSGSDFSVVQYSANFENGNLNIQRILGNGVITNIDYDPVQKRTLGLQTVKDSSTYESKTYGYDDKGNYTQIQDIVNPVRSQTFSYDDLNRLTSATGVYGTETYQYSNAGKLLKKGNLTYSYGDSSHTNAVTQVAENATTYTYSYDASGNMVNRNGLSLAYDPFQKLKRIETTDQGTINFDYDFTGTRIRKTSLNDGTKTISLGGLYEVVFVLGKDPKHTLYFKGEHGDLVGQWTRVDADLISSVTLPSSFLTTGQVALNTLAWNITDLSIKSAKYFLFARESMVTLALVFLFFAFCFGVLHLREGIWNSVLKFSAPLLILSLSNCSILIPGGNGNPPWEEVLLIDSNTPSVSTGSGAVFPVDGFLFLHPDHLGSITMATDGSGNRITGGTEAGASHISYDPYGEIDRSDSFGPDIFRYKYTGQEEDKETGLYYYKARYYDPIIGRFLQADDRLDAGNPDGMDVYMYTEGNPTSNVDPSGHSWVSSLFSRNGLGFLNFSINLSGFLQRAFYVSSQRYSDFGDRFLTSFVGNGDAVMGTPIQGGRNSKEGSWFDRQVTDPIQHMSTQELIVAGIVFAVSVAAAYFIGPEAGGAIEASFTSAMGVGEGATLLASVFGFVADVVIGLELTLLGANLAEALGALSTSSPNNIYYDKDAGVAMKDIGASAADMGGLVGSIWAASERKVTRLYIESEQTGRPAYESIAMGGPAMESEYANMRNVVYIREVQMKILVAPTLDFYLKTAGGFLATCAIYKGNKNHECSF
ncbi:RHS repeat-associated core domain-containing protein [Leptospira sarikeiensis]|uniref:Type IV secretion protein Rhs n=1 Tax=Leptospira sarikeiensis TaxID=2484943 RepID=A0A4V3JRC9_9LEPT|nr:RHS repeat-associated core domain-containing protein [Leptospira sarikeiensis]TGL59515.1 type IV secretion protein Rhs [Leptospira sarikeiensis]